MIEDISNRELNDLIFDKIDIYFDNIVNHVYEENRIMIQYLDRKLKQIGYELTRENLIYFSNANNNFRKSKTRQEISRKTDCRN